MLAAGDGQGGSTAVLKGGIDIFRFQRTAGHGYRAVVIDAEAACRVRTANA